MNKKGKSRTIMYREALNEALREEMQRDPDVFCIGENLKYGGPYKATAGLQEEFGPLRVVDTPICEAGFTAAAFGAAVTGMRPVVEIMFVEFAMLAMDAVVNEASKLRLMTGGQGKAPMVIRVQQGVGEGLAAQHSSNLEALYYHIPGLKVVIPTTPYDAKGLLKTSIRDDDPVIFIEHKLLYMTKGEVPEEEYTVDFGRGEVVRRGKDVTLIAWSHMVHEAHQAAKTLAREGVEVEIIDPRTLVPLDREIILESVRKTEHVVIAQEAPRRGGVASDICSISPEEVFDDLDAPVTIVAGKNTAIPFNMKLEKACVPWASDIAAAVKRVLNFN